MKISVIVPVYNSQKYLAECIESIINQTYKNIELILVNDGSTDNSEEICKSYLLKNNNIKLINIENSGSAVARNVGIDNANGDYIAFIDSDDTIHQEMFYELISQVRKTPYDIVSCDLKNISAIGIDIGLESSLLRGGYYTKKDIEELIFPYLINTDDLSQNKWPMRMVTKIYNRKFLQDNQLKFVDELKAAQDFVFSVATIYKASNFFYLKEAYYYNYRENMSSRTHTFLDRALENYIFMNAVLRDIVTENSEYDFSSQLALSKFHSILSSISYLYRPGGPANLIYKYSKTKNIIERLKDTKSLKLINFNKLNIKKKIYYILVKYNQVLLITLLTSLYYQYLKVSKKKVYR